MYCGFERYFMSETLVTSAELQKSFGRYREKALQEPVVITNHGRESLVLLSAQEYRRLKSQDRRALHPWELGSREVEGLRASQVAPEAAEFNHEYTP
jgi:prevent-host-death family protein